MHIQQYYNFSLWKSYDGTIREETQVQIKVYILKMQKVGRLFSRLIGSNKFRLSTLNFIIKMPSFDLLVRHYELEADDP